MLNKYEYSFSPNRRSSIGWDYFERSCCKWDGAVEVGVEEVEAPLPKLKSPKTDVLCVHDKRAKIKGKVLKRRII